MTILKSKHLTLWQKKLLFEAHKVHKLKECNSALVYNLQCNPHTLFYKDKNYCHYFSHTILTPNTIQPAGRCHIEIPQQPSSNTYPSHKILPTNLPLQTILVKWNPQLHYSHYYLMPYLYLDKKLTSSPLTPLPGSLLFKKLSRQKSTQPSVHPSARRTTPPKSDHQTPQSHFAISILGTGSFIHFLYYIKNNHDLTSTFPSFTMFTTLSFTKECLRPANSALILFYYLS